MKKVDITPEQVQLARALVNGFVDGLHGESTWAAEAQDARHPGVYEVAALGRRAGAVLRDIVKNSRT